MDWLASLLLCLQKLFFLINLFFLKELVSIIQVFSFLIVLAKNTRKAKNVDVETGESTVK